VQVNNDENFDYNSNERNNGGDDTTRRKNFVTAMEYYSYRIQIRRDSPNSILKSTRLFHQYAVDMYVKIKTDRLNFLRQN